MNRSPGDRLGAYEILASVGAGGMGEVYRARDTKLGRDVALKLLTDTVSSDSERRARFDREARTLASLNHRASSPSTPLNKPAITPSLPWNWWKVGLSPT